MKGFGTYNDWANYYASSSSSNLSASATPFSVNRISSIDQSDDAMYPTFPYRYNNNSFLNSPSSVSSNQFNYPGFQVLDSNNAPKPSLVQPPQYYAPFAVPDRNSSSIVPDNWTSFSGFTLSDQPDYAKKSHELGFSGQSAANQFSEFDNGKSKQVGIGGSRWSSNQTNFAGSVAEERINLGCQDITDSHGEVPHMIGWEKHSLPTSADHLDDKSCWWRTTKPMPVDFSHTSGLQFPSLSVETHHEAPLKLAVDSGNHHFQYTGVYDKHLGQQDKLSRVDTVPPAPITGSVTDFNTGIIVPDGDLGHNNFYDLKEAHPTPSYGTAGCFGLGHLRMHLDINEPSSSNNAMISDMNVSEDVVDYIHNKASNEFQNLHPNLGLSTLRLNAIQHANSVDKLLECGDLCNPSVDSPCWKGAPTAHFSYYESSEALPPEHVPKNEECFSSVIQEPQNFRLDTDSNVRKSCDSSFPMHIRIVGQETSSEGSPRKFSETRFVSEDCKSDGAVNAGPFQSAPCCGYGLLYQDDITKMKGNSVPPTKPIDCESGSSHDEHQDIEDNKSVSQKLCIGGADAECNENVCLESGTSHTGGHALSLSSSVEDAPTAPEKSAANVSTEKLNVQILVDTMQNLSQLVLNHCLNDACELKDRDCNILRNVISNLNTCLLKKAEQISPAPERIFHQPETFRCAEESCDLQRGPQLTKIEPESSMIEHKNLLAQKAGFGSGKSHWKLSDSIYLRGGAEMTKAEKMPIDALENLPAQKADLFFGSGKPQWKHSDSISSSGGAEMTKEESMTKALKNILSENFDDDDGATEPQTLLYKNLWLEAEAALCSVSYKARYNQMKIEMEKHTFKQRDTEEQSKSEVIPILSRSQSSAIEVNNCLNSDSSAQDLAFLDSSSTNPKELSQLKFSSDTNMSNSLTPEAGGCQNLYSFIRNYAVSGTNKEAAGNDETSVMARYRVIKARTDKSCINTNDLETPSNIADKLAPREIDDQNQVNSCKDSAIPGKNKTDFETSVLARFHILRSRAAEDSSSVSSTEKLLDGVGFSGEGIEGTMITKNVLESKRLDADLNSYTAVDKSIPKEIHLDLEDSQEIEPCRTYEFQLPNYHSDLASDWEHI